MVIYGHERRDVATCDVAGAFLIPYIDSFVVIKLDGDMVDIMCGANNSYKTYVIYEFGKKILFMILLKSLYVIMQATLLWYRTFVKYLKADEFEINKYNSCIANKIVNGKQCTVCWHVDDTQISHVDKNVVSAIIKNIENEFGTMTVTRGKEYNFVGMNFKLKDDGAVSITIKDYIEQCITSYEEEVKNNSTKIPANNKLFNNDVNSNKLGQDKSEILHHIVAKLLFVMKRVRLYICTIIEFLSSRVTKSTKVDRIKLKRLL